jgi:hypothetical protein
VKPETMPCLRVTAGGLDYIGHATDAFAGLAYMQQRRRT